MERYSKETNGFEFSSTVQPRDTRPRAPLTLQVPFFKLGPKKFELNEFM